MGDQPDGGLGNCIDYGSANTADHHLLARRLAANVLPARLPMIH